MLVFSPRCKRRTIGERSHVSKTTSDVAGFGDDECGPVVGPIIVTPLFDARSKMKVAKRDGGAQGQTLPASEPSLKGDETKGKGK
jgi:hypothetical protein